MSLDGINLAPLRSW
jgi:hypothetical protein